MKLRVRVLIIAILSIVLLSCDSQKSPSGYQYPDLDPTTRGALLEYSKVKTMSKSQVQSLFKIQPIHLKGKRVMMGSIYLPSWAS
jgi:hypothetical protein